MKKHTWALLPAAALAAALMAGCTNNKTVETTAPTTTEEATTAAPEPENKKAQLVIAGGDAAGLTAAVQAVAEGMDPSQIMILQTNGALGADLASMDIYLNASNTDEQYDQEIEDSFEAYLADIMKAGAEKNTQELAETMAENSEEALIWVREQGIELEGVTKQEGSSVARSYASVEEQKLPEALRDTLTQKVEELKIQVIKDVKVEELLLTADESLAGVKITGADGEETIDCIAVVIADKELIPLFQDIPAAFTTDGSEAQTGLIINNCAEILSSEGTGLPGLYAAGSIIDPAVHGDKPLAGNQLTATVLFGSTAGTEASIYVSDNK